MKFNFNGFDDKGIPTHVSTDDGYMQTSREFNIEEDGWMLDQLHYSDFPVIQEGRRVQRLVDEVNQLRKENFTLTKREKVLLDIAII